ncbi:hypothetical protein Tco_0028274, partial [Tanacetum coccineum]
RRELEDVDYVSAKFEGKKLKLVDKLETDEKGKIEAVQLCIKEQVEVMVVAMT